MKILSYITSNDRRTKFIKTFNNIVDILHDNGISYNEIDKLLTDIILYYKEQREQIEYDTPKDYFEDNKRCDIGDCVPDKLSDELKELLGIGELP